MKTALTGIPELHAGEIAELYTFTLSSGAAFYYTTFDIDLRYRNQVYLSGALNFDRGTIRTGVGVEVDEVTVTLYPGNDSMTTLPAFCNNGGLDGAWVKMERARQAYVVHLFEGMVSDAVADRTKVELTISAGTLLLNMDMPRNVYAPGCIHTLFDAGCSLSKSSFAEDSAVLTGSTKRFLYCELTQAAGYFDLGTITFTSGINNGVTHTIRNNDVGVIALSYPLQNTPEVGDTFIAVPGCDKRLTTCTSPFNNAVNYRGYPFIPVTEDSI